MSRYYFTEEQIKELESIEYVEKVTTTNITFTIEFKHTFYGLLLEGYGPTYALYTLGINPKILGKERIQSLGKRIRKQAKREAGFTRMNGSGRPKKITFDSPEEEIKYLKNQIKYQKQEIEFLKKLEALDKKYQ